MLYKAPYPEGKLCDREGSYLLFAKTKAEREAGHDSRQSLAKRYGDQARFVAKTSAAAAALVLDRLLLDEDAARFVAAARATTAFPP